jgi:hypothetical protein
VCIKSQHAWLKALSSTQIVDLPADGLIKELHDAPQRRKIIGRCTHEKMGLNTKKGAKF